MSRPLALSLALTSLCAACYPFGTPIGHFEFPCRPFNVRSLDTSRKNGVPDERIIVKHAIFVTSEGTPLRPRVGGCSVPMRDSVAYGQYIHGILDNIRADSAWRGAPRNVMLRIHGGLNTLNGSLTATVAMTQAIKDDSTAGVYPLFVNWESGLVSAYGEHLFLIRRGHRSTLKGWSLVDPLLSPFYLTADLGGGLARAPLSVGKQIFSLHGHDWWRNTQLECPSPDSTIRATGDSRCSRGRAKQDSIVADAEASLLKKQEVARDKPQGRPAAIGVPPRHEGAIAVSRFAYKRSKAEMLLHIATGVALTVIPPRYLTNPKQALRTSFNQSYHSTSNTALRLFRILGWIPPKIWEITLIDALGTPAWETMHRRSSILIRPAHEFDRHAADTGYHSPGGALAVLLDSLQGLAKRDRAYRISLVGHSMGAIVATE